MTDSLRLLCVFAHPDDESMGMGGTLAKYSAQGVETHLICASRGERGWSGPEEQNPGLETLGKFRERELENAVQELGMQGLYFLDYIDGEVDRANPAEAIQKIATHIRHIMPQVVVTFPPDGNYGHPDQLRGEVPWPNWMITTRIDLAEHCHAAWRAVQCHKSQLPTLGRLADVDEDTGAAVLAMQGTFYRTFSLVNGGRELEKDLFEGIRI